MSGSAAVQVDVGSVRSPAAALDAGVVHEHVETAELIGDRGDGAFDALLVRDVELLRHDTIAQLAGSLLAACEIA